MPRVRTAIVVLAAAIGAAGCGQSSGPSASELFAQKDDPKNLKALVDLVVTEAEAGRDEAGFAERYAKAGDSAKASEHRKVAAQHHRRAATLIRAMIPDAAAAARAMRDDAPADFKATYLEKISRVPTVDAEVATLFKRGASDATQINVHAATTEELIANKPDSVGYAEFPKGAHRLAAAVLRPGVTFYEVELVKPGDNGGLKYHLFFWDGARWRMFGPAWRNLPGGAGADD